MSTGAWQVDSVTCNGADITDRRGRIVARVTGGDTIQKLAANAHAMAAARDMLAYLKEFVEAWRENVEDEEDGIDPYLAGEFIAESYPEIQALIAKAEGKLQ